MPIFIPLLALGGAFVALTGKPREIDTGASDADIATYGGTMTEESWRPKVAAQAAAAGIPEDVAMRWMHIESGGNACAVGKLTSMVGSEYREMGIGQLYNPDDFTRLGIDPASYRAYCIPGTQQLSRALTDNEQDAQVAGLIGLISACRSSVRSKMASAGVAWDESGADFWAMVKLQHGLPVFASAIGKVAADLGRPPDSFAEFGAALHDAGTGYAASDIDRVLSNANRTAGLA